MLVAHSVGFIFWKENMGMNSKHIKQVNRKKNRMIHDGVPGPGKIDFKSWKVLKLRKGSQ